MKSNTVLIKVEGGNASVVRRPNHIIVRITDHDRPGTLKENTEFHITPPKERFSSCYAQLEQEGQLVIGEFQLVLLEAFPLYWDAEFRNSCTDLDDIVIQGTHCLWVVSSTGLELVHSDGEQIKLDCLEKHEVIDFADSLLLDWNQLLKELKIYGDKIKSGTAYKA